MNHSKRVNTIELWRFFFCMAVLGLHIGGTFEIPFFTGGYLGVEFFFLLSGYGIGVYYQKHIRDTAWSKKLYELGLYIGRRLKQLYPLYFAALIFMIIVRLLDGEWKAAEVVTHLKNGWAEFLLMQCGPLGNEVLISADWYVASVFWGGIIVLLLLIMTDKIGGLFLCPVIGIGIYGYYFKLIGKIDVIFSYHALLRGIAGICLGVFLCFLISSIDARRKKAQQEYPADISGIQTKDGAAEVFGSLNKEPQDKITDKTDAGRGLREKCPEKRKGMTRVWYILANIVFLAIFIYTYNGHRCWKDFLVIALYWISLFWLFMTKIQFGEKTEKAFGWLGRITYPIYILHMPVLELIKMLLH